MGKIPTAEEFLLSLGDADFVLSKSGLTISKMMIEFARLHVINELKKHVEHPTKPGYRRHDIVNRIKELEK